MGILSRLGRMGAATAREAFDTPLGRSRMADAFKSSPMFSGRNFNLSQREIEALEAASRGLSDDDMLRLMYFRQSEIPESKLAQILLRKANRKIGAPDDYRWDDGLLPPETF